MAIYQRGNGGHVAEREQPEPASDREKELQALVDSGKGNWSRVEDAEPESAGQDGGEAKRPAKSASKEEWVAYAVAQGADEAEAKKATKDDLIQAYGG